MTETEEKPVDIIAIFEELAAKAKALYPDLEMTDDNLQTMSAQNYSYINYLNIINIEPEESFSTQISKE